MNVEITLLYANDMDFNCISYDFPKGGKKIKEVRAENTQRKGACTVIIFQPKTSSQMAIKPIEVAHAALMYCNDAIDQRVLKKVVKV